MNNQNQQDQPPENAPAVASSVGLGGNRHGKTDAAAKAVNALYQRMYPEEYRCICLVPWIDENCPIHEINGLAKHHAVLREKDLPPNDPKLRHSQDKI